MAKQECVLKFKEGSQEPRKVTLDGLVESELPPIAAGDAGKVLTVKSDESGVEYAEAQGGSLPEGGNNGDVLTKDSSVAAGVKWAAPQGGGSGLITVCEDVSLTKAEASAEQFMTAAVNKNLFPSDFFTASEKYNIIVKIAGTSADGTGYNFVAKQFFVSATEELFMAFCHTVIPMELSELPITNNAFINSVIMETNSEDSDSIEVRYSGAIKSGQSMELIRILDEGSLSIYLEQIKEN